MFVRPKGKAVRFFKASLQYLRSLLSFRVYLGKSMTRIPDGSIVFFPYRENVVCCGIAGIVSVKNTQAAPEPIDVPDMEKRVRKILTNGYMDCQKNKLPLSKMYLGGEDVIHTLLQTIRSYKREAPFSEIFRDKEIKRSLEAVVRRLWDVIEAEEKFLADRMGHLDMSDTEVMASRIEDLKDIHWCLAKEIVDNIKNVRALTARFQKTVTSESIRIFREINAVLNSIDRLEVRGRDSAGISLMFVLTAVEHGQFENQLKQNGMYDEFVERSDFEALLNRGIHVRHLDGAAGEKSVAVTVTYKVAAEIGSLGDNVRYLRSQIQSDPILHGLTSAPHTHHSVLSHTRWASMGAITEANCHPVDNNALETKGAPKGWIHVCLNGDIDNFLDLKADYEDTGARIPGDITTDTKIIPLQIEKYINENHSVEEAFRLAVNDFRGSHAISMHTDLAPGKVFLAQKGSGQAVFVGLADDHYMPTSEVYGFVEETSSYVKMDGDRVFEGADGSTQGQIFTLDQTTSGGAGGIKAMYYDGTPLNLEEKDVRHTEITSRDIDRQDFPHYFLKEVSEAPKSIEKTLQNRWKIKDDDAHQYMLVLDESVVPEKITKALKAGQIRRIYFIGQGTAGVAALACSNILNYYLNDPTCQIGALKASELSGFNLTGRDGEDQMTDTLVFAISQSGTTTDTNRTVDMVRERGGHTIAIVNRRDSDITFKADGVMYTSSGRDLEMSVASTKAFYSQIVAAALLGLHIARAQDRRDDDFVSDEIKQLRRLPSHMREVLSQQRTIEASAKRLAAKKTYWAAVGSGPNKASSDEIRIKLSELCYKTISSDYVEDKKHIDLSSEPLIIVCAAGARGAVIGDIVKDAAIFRAHKAAPVVIADEGEQRFDAYAEDVFNVPAVDEHLAPIMNTLVGHLWGYYAALAINEGSRLLFDFQREIQKTVDEYAKQGVDIYEVILEKPFREKIARFYERFRKIRNEDSFPAAIALASDLTLLLKYLSGRLPVSDFEIDFGEKGTAHNMLNTLYKYLGESINRMARPVDAIKHQAKTVTVGTSRIADRMEGVIYDVLYDYNFKISQLTPKNVIVLRNLQGVIENINGSILYHINNLNLLGELTDDARIEIVEKRGLLKSMPSRVETDHELKGTKRIIAREGNVYIGMGRTDGRSILIIPVISDAPSKPNIIDNLLLMNISFKDAVALSVRTKALGGKYERIKNIVQESSVPWDDGYLDEVEMKELFGISAEKIADLIVTRIA